MTPRCDGPALSRPSLVCTLAAAALLAAACSNTTSNGPGPAAAGTGGAGSGGSRGGSGGSNQGGTGGGGIIVFDAAQPGSDTGAGGTSGPAPDGGPPMTCASLRNCVTACATDTACIQRCESAATPAARAGYAQVTMCSRQECEHGDEVCRCRRECLDMGACLAIVDTCRDFEDDVFCDVNCH